MKNWILFLALFPLHLGAQTTHPLTMGDEGFSPDTLYLLPGDSVFLTFTESGHSMVQVPHQSWLDEVPAPLIGLSLGDGTPNVGFVHTFVLDSLGSFYYLCTQHPEEKMMIMVGNFSSVQELQLPGFRVFPQPAQQDVRFDHPGNISSIRITDRQGRVVQHIAHRSPEHPLDVSGLESGLYFMTLLDAAGEPVARERLLIAR
jgi:plastocyanin